MRRRPPADPPAIRLQLIEHYRKDLEQFGDRHQFDDGAIFCSPWPQRIAALEAGEPVEVYGWEICQLRSGIDAQVRYRVDANGTTTPIPRRA